MLESETGRERLDRLVCDEFGRGFPGALPVAILLPGQRRVDQLMGDVVMLVYPCAFLDQICRGQVKLRTASHQLSSRL